MKNGVEIIKLPRVLLIHNLPTPYRTDLFNRVSSILLENNIDFIVLFQVAKTKRRNLWIGTQNDFKFKFYISKTIPPNQESQFLRIPSRPLKELRRNFPSVIIATGFNVHTLAALLYTRLYNIPLIIWTGEKEIRGYYKYLRVAIRKFILKYTSHLFIYGTASENFYQKKFKYPKLNMTKILNVIPVRHEIDVSERIRSKTHILSEGQLILLFVGDLIKNKGIYLIPYLLKSITLMASKYAVNLKIIGEGSERKTLYESLLSERLNRYVQFLGKIPNSEVLKEMATSHFLLFPTLGDTWGHVITEAFCVGTPVLTSRFAGAVPDMLSENKNGFVVDFNEPLQVAEKIYQIITNPSEYEKMCKSSVRSYHELFNSLDNAQTMVNVIMQHIKKRKSMTQ